jgi:hypothetical protein
MDLFLASKLFKEEYLSGRLIIQFYSLRSFRLNILPQRTQRFRKERYHLFISFFNNTVSVALFCGE